MRKVPFLSLIVALALAFSLTLPAAAAQAAPQLVLSSTQESASQEVGLSGLPQNSQSLQITLTLSQNTPCTFQPDSGLDLSRVHTALSQNGRAVTLYLTASSGLLTSDGTLTLGTLSGETAFTVEKASGLKVLDDSLAETLYPTVEGGAGSSSGSDSGNSSGGGSRPLFLDVAPGAWYYQAVEYVSREGLMAGVGASLFAPDITTSRAMIVTILYRLEGTPQMDQASPFTDVEDSAWYANAVTWANAQGIVTGYGGGRFGPEDTITREQMAAILYKYAQYKGQDTSKQADLSVYTDQDQVSAYARNAVSWAVAQGLISGTAPGVLSPGGSTTRAQAAVILAAFSKGLAA